MSPYSIELRDLTKSYGNKVVVQRLNLVITSGTVFDFLGPNGAGKITTIKTMTGMLSPESGDALIEGISIQQEPVTVKRRIGVVPDRLAFFEHLTV